MKRSRRRSAKASVAAVKATPLVKIAALSWSDAAPKGAWWSSIPVMPGIIQPDEVTLPWETDRPNPCPTATWAAQQLREAVATAECRSC